MPKRVTDDMWLARCAKAFEEKARVRRTTRRSMPKTVHFVQHGLVACMMEMPPAVWPEGHVWSPDWAKVNCPGCLAGKVEMDNATFSIDLNGPAIVCKRCNYPSYNLEDVERHYCPRCRVSHDDIWPPARKWWREHPDNLFLS